MVYRQDIDGIRAMAIIAVVLYHAFPQYFPGGFLGVDIFFVISGYLVIGKFFESSFNLKQFYTRRIQRILPSLLLVLVTLMMIGYFFMYANEYQSLSRHVMSTLLFSNHWLLMHEMGYFDKLADFKPLLQLWSLSIEEQFYLFLPWLVFIFYKKNWSLRVGLFSLFVMSLSYDVLLTFQGIDTYYSPACRLWEFCLGGLLVQRRLFKKDLSCLVLIFMLIGLFYLDTFPQRLIINLLVCLGTALFIAQPGWVNDKILQKKSMIYIGLISYPWYLWHWSLLSCFRIIYAGSISFNLTLVLISLSIFLSILTYQGIEIPIRRIRYQGKIAVFCLFLLLVLGLVASVIDMQQGLLLRPINLERKTLMDDLQNFDTYKKKLIKCHVDGVDLCLKNNAKMPWYVVWGDSHSEHIFPGLVKQLPNKSGMLISTHSCPPLLGVNAFWQGQVNSCLQTNEHVLQSLKHLPSVKIVILSAVGLFYISHAVSEEQMIQAFSPMFFKLQLDNDKQLDKPQVFLRGMQQTITALQKLGKTVIVLEDNPLLPIMPIQCLSRPLQKSQDMCQLPLKQVMYFQKDYHQLIETLRVQNPDVVFYSSMQALCHDNHCPIIENGHFLYRDSQHLSLAASDKLAKGLLASFPNLQDTYFLADKAY